ncbi:MAG: hypothetical protein V3T77_04435 [Planctomycetota bacterium]
MSERWSLGTVALLMLVIALIIGSGLIGCASVHYDVIIRNGKIYDGSVTAPCVGDVAIRGDKIVLLRNGQHTNARPGRALRRKTIRQPG